MPFVRYARDRRGYETVYVMHAFEGAEKNPRVRVLYACRTVPHARVGRLSLDEGVQRRIEQAYPSLRFEWPRLLKEAAASAPRPERPDPRAGEPRGKQRRERKSAQGKVPQVRFPVQQVQQVQPPATIDAPESVEAPEPLDPITELVEWTALEEPAQPAEPEEPMEPLVPEPAPEAEDVPFVVGPLVVDRNWPVVDVVGADRALILRGRYIELAHRVLSRVSSPAERTRLLRETARLNPETWTTEDQAREATAGFEAAYGALAQQLRQPPS